MMEYPQNQLFTAEESRRIDRKTIREFGIGGFTLMEIAAVRAVDEILTGDIAHRKILAVCGKGNNAGDALAVCRYLCEHRAEIDIYFPLGSESLSPDTQKNLDLIRKIKEQSSFPIQILESRPKNCNKYDIILDGLFGTGLDREITGELKSLIEDVNQSGAAVFAMDIPSGLHADTGQVMGAAVKAFKTLMFGTAKLGCYTGVGPEFSGERIFCRLPFPSHLMKQKPEIRIFNGNPPETPVTQTDHKYANGVCWIIAGSPGLTGAAVLASKAAWKTGCGAVSAFVPTGLMPAFDAHLVEQVRIPVGPQNGKMFTPECTDFILEQIENRPGVVVLGPGLGRDEETIAFTKTFLESYSGDVVIDADALFALSKLGTKVIHPDASVVLTPHPGEFNRIFGGHERDPRKLPEILSTLPNPGQSMILAKGAPLFAAGLHRIHVTGYDTRAFSRTGFGDVLTGLIAGFWSRGIDPEIAILCALSAGYEKIKENRKDQILTPFELI